MSCIMYTVGGYSQGGGGASETQHNALQTPLLFFDLLIHACKVYPFTVFAKLDIMYAKIQIKCSGEEGCRK